MYLVLHRNNSVVNIQYRDINPHGPKLYRCPVLSVILSLKCQSNNKKYLIFHETVSEDRKTDRKYD